MAVTTAKRILIAMSVIGRIVGGAYRVTRLIGRGGMGEVYAADGPQGEVAVKFLRETHANEPEIVARFQREAKIAARIHSEYVATVHGAGRDRDGHLWIAFDLLEGESLDARLRRTPQLAASEIGWIVSHVLTGLARAHGVGVIHRDIKPANIFLETVGDRARAKILDFGISKLRAATSETVYPALTAAEGSLGTVSFMPPEQDGGAIDADERADLYAVGAVAFLALSGVLPFVGDTPTAVLTFKRTSSALSLREATGVTWPEPVEEFMRRTLARRREDRFTSADETRLAWEVAFRAPGMPVPSRSISRGASPDDTDVNPPQSSSTE